MSVAQIRPEEYGVFAAICVKLELLALADACNLCEVAATGNRRAFEHQYGEFSEPVTADDIEREALHVLASPERMIDRSFGPLAYNMIANDGTAYDETGQTTQTAPILDQLLELEKKAQSWQEAKQREKTRQAENDEAFAEVGPLEVLTAEEIRERCKAAGCDRVITASFMVNESDPYTDYHGGRTARTVVIGFGKGKRENFKQLRKAAASFPPTAFFGPGKDLWTVEANKSPDDAEPYRRGQMLRDDSGRAREFSTREEAEAAVAELLETHEQCRSDYTGVVDFPHFAGRYGVNYIRSRLEQRENYSMGGGNYLGHDRYSGWKVSSTRAEWLSADCEFFQPPKKRSKPKKQRKREDRATMISGSDYTEWL